MVNGVILNQCGSLLDIAPAAFANSTYNAPSHTFPSVCSTTKSATNTKTDEKKRKQKHKNYWLGG